MAKKKKSLKGKISIVLKKKMKVKKLPKIKRMTVKLPESGGIF